MLSVLLWEKSVEQVSLHRILSMVVNRADKIHAGLISFSFSLHLDFNEPCCGLLQALGRLVTFLRTYNTFEIESKRIDFFNNSKELFDIHFLGPDSMTVGYMRHKFFKLLRYLLLLWRLSSGHVTEHLVPLRAQFGLLMVLLLFDHALLESIGLLDPCSARDVTIGLVRYFGFLQLWGQNAGVTTVYWIWDEFTWLVYHNFEKFLPNIRLQVLENEFVNIVRFRFLSCECWFVKTIKIWLFKCLLHVVSYFVRKLLCLPKLVEVVLGWNFH